jgi:hypothetical protein
MLYVDDCSDSVIVVSISIQVVNSSVSYLFLMQVGKRLLPDNLLAQSLS